MDLRNYYYPLESYTQEVRDNAFALNMPKIELSGYVDKVYKFLGALKPNYVIQIDNICAKETKKLFVSIIKMFIFEVRNNKISFGKNYETIIKN